MIENDDAKKYIRSQSMAAMPKTHDDMVCKNCIFKDENLPSGHCVIYRKGIEFKPNKVILGGECDYFAEE